MTKAEIKDLTSHARYWLRVIDKIVKQPGSLDDLSSLSERRLMRAVTEGSGAIGSIESLFIDAGYEERN